MFSKIVSTTAKVAGALGVSATMAMSAFAQSASDPIKIGFIDDMSGPYSGLSGPGAFEAAKMAIEDFGGKVLDREIQLISVDDQNKTDLAVAGARRLFTEEKVGMITGLSSSASALAIQGIARELNKINIVSSAGSSTLTGESCSPNGFHWTFDSYAVTTNLANSLVSKGDDTWFFIAVDYILGQVLIADSSDAIEKGGGKIVGVAKHPLGNADFSSQILSAQGSGAKVIALANAAADTENSLKAVNEFNVTASGQKLAVFYLHTAIVESVGQDLTKGLLTTTPFYPEMSDTASAFNKRFVERRGRPASITINQAMAYSGVNHYLRAVEAAGTDETAAVLAKMKELPVNDFFTKDAKIAANGKLLRDMFVVEVKDPAESTGKYDFFKLVEAIPGEKAFRTGPDSGCDL